MLTPALAYYSPATQNIQYIQDAVKQATYYRQVLQANTTASWQGLWVHIVGPQSATYGVWLTGNGWAALGMVRVLAVMTNWSRTAKWTTQPALIKKYIYEILDGCMAAGFSPDGTGLLANYLVGDSSGQTAKPNGNFGDATGTAMIASVAYRMMVLDPAGAKGYKTWANKLRTAVAAQVKSNGYVNQTVNPYDWYDTTPYTSGSPEGQAAAVLMATAYGACVSASRC
ncbi:hypothetical protein BCV69DRAFT_282710 [Microstroma glucosiphilum]|uniref:Six-hairpin glycosidase n=1 Tax=Pseudomicrostroma glucosiphilum TaxID=1684307 RepID=A0A316U9R5_9BASI|nr:hypothetical protein BCV69DRAFT_282710 [Pseudomicrostroma glucosiphilum]PWN21221.1 hypothetical protein BCV69DRAFT_282710 [Pseudomicrostroma glucosiphilum]